MCSGDGFCPGNICDRIWKMATALLIVAILCGIVTEVNCNETADRNCSGTAVFGRNCSLSCNCLDGCHSDGTCQQCTEGWRGPTCQIRIANVALNKPATQGPSSSADHPASLAVDGDFADNARWSLASEKAFDTMVWWSVDLGSMETIENLTVVYKEAESGNDYHRTMKRRRGHSVWLSNASYPTQDQGQGRRCFHDNGQGDMNQTLHITCLGIARYVRVDTVRYDGMDNTIFSKWPNLELVEVSVIAEKGCSKGTYGDLCEHQCGHCQDTRCSREDGHCAPCHQDWTGNTCMTELCQNCENGQDSSEGCLPDWYGDNCSVPCEGNCTNSTCDINTGFCLNCPVGLKGYLCNETCPRNCDSSGCNIDGSCHACVNNSFYGSMCLEPCNTNCSGCFQNNGTCIGCQKGLYGVYCDRPCSAKCARQECDLLGHCKFGCTDPHHFGGQCDQKCSENITNCETCDSQNELPECRTCSAAKFGVNCENDCPANCESCLSANNCTKCSEGFSGATCKIITCIIKNCTTCNNNGYCVVCNPGLFGDNCDQTCPDCATCMAGDPKSTPACLTCKEGLFLNDNSCVKCSVTCKVCSSQSECSQCKRYFYGQACADECPINCVPAGQFVCDGQTGTCSGDCIDGFYGDYCNKSCLGNCGTSSGRQGCNKLTGVCFTCSDGYFGEHCNISCGKNCFPDSGSGSCNRSTGKCDSCKQMFYGDTCEKHCPTNCDFDCDRETGKCNECSSGYYGDYCRESCPEHCGPGPNSTRVVCDKSDATCLFCTVGFYGERCEQYCENNCALIGNYHNCEKTGGVCKGCQNKYFGDFCKSTCDHCKHHTCDQDTGHCIEGCKRGWFNRTCSERCSSTCRGENCDWLTGVCLTGCVNGFTGQFCKSAASREEGTSAFPIIIGVTVPVILILLAVVIVLIIRYHRKSSRASAGYRGGRIPMGNMNGTAENGERHALIHNNGSTVVNALPLPKKNQKTTSLSDDDLLEQDETSPLVPQSTDPSDYYNLSWPVPVADFPAYVRDKRANSASWYRDDFNNLPKGLLKKCNVSMEMANKGKCRYKQLYPYDDNRVKLEPDGKIHSDFINASYVNGYKNPQGFIAAQGPTDVNVNDFWRMIFQKDCGKVVMLTNLFEECKMKCVRYWPDFDETQEYGSLEVVMISENSFPDYIMRNLKATHKITREEKDFILFHFTAWPDRGVPDNPSCMLNFRAKVMEDYGVPDGPILVHCSAGIGRTGTFVALDYLLRRAAVESHIDVFRTVTDMRYQRTNFVQTDVQYNFLHNAIAEALQTKEMEVPCAEFCKHYWSLLEVNPETGKTKLQEQFEVLNQISPELDQSSYQAGSNEENLHKSRWPDVLPVDMYRAYLSTPAKGSNEFINAVFLPTALNKTGFLLTQMPLPHTITDFWRLVFDHHVTSIVMMNNIDDDDETIGEYWPSDDCTYGPFKLELLSCENFEDYSTMTIKLTYSSTSRSSSMVVKQYRFESWPADDLVPPSTFALTALVGAVAMASNNHTENPTIVHCMNGAERSGLFCVLSAIFEKLQGDQKINIPQTILHWRNRRPQIIPNLEQFDFCYKAVSEYLDSQQIYSNVL